MINKISFKNYKVFKNKQILELKPITILIGKNNVGKSAILKLPTLIEGSLSGNFDSPFQLENYEVKIANEYSDVIYGKQFKALELELFQDDLLSKETNRLETHILINKGRPEIEHWKLNDFIPTNPKYKGINIIKSTENTEIFQLPVFNITTDFIGAVRQDAKSNYDYTIDYGEKSKTDGSNLYEFLINDYLTTDKKYFNRISNWIRDKFEGWELSIEVDGYKKELPALIELQRSNLKINLSQTGMGITQSLPLITRAFKPCEEETLIIIEEPESHLHPYAHAQLAQLFAESLKEDSNKKYLIETHSQNFILRLRRLVAEGFLEMTDLGIYYVDFDEAKNESVLTEINVDVAGGVAWWPDGIFGETTLEARAIMNANINDLRNVD